MEKSDQSLKNFMEEFFDFDGLVEIGFFKEEMRNDYQAQADRVCRFFGYETVYEYGAKTVSCHLSYLNENELHPDDQENYTGRPLHVNESGELKQAPFITTFRSIYE